MANDLNQCNFIGRLGRDPEQRFSQDGSETSSFSIACGWKTASKEGTEWINVVAFGKLAQICNQYLAKGKQVYISGRYNTQKWQDRETGQDRYSTRIIADRMQMLGSRDDGQADARPQAPQRPQRQNDYAQASEGGMRSQAPLPDDSDIPF